MRRMSRWPVVMLLAATPLVVAGCASIDKRGDAAASVALRMLSAVQRQDGAAACAVLAPDTAMSLAESGKPCAEAILQEDLPAPGAVTASQVYGQWAQVRLTGDTVFLGVFPDGWRVVAAGCTPREDRPYDCVLAGG